jgi:AcrR family transcriptional regulator
MCPTPEPRWRRLPEERPHQIIQAAIEIFDKKGLSGARLEDIAKQAGVSKGTIYLYFPNKEELFREMVRNTLIETIAWGEQLPDDQTATEQITRYMEQFWDLASTPSYMTIYRIVTGEIHLFPDLADFYFQEVVIRARSMVERIIRRGIDRGEFRPIEPALASRMLSALFLTNAMWCRKRQYFPQLQDFTDEQVRTELIDFYLHALRAYSP